jgi:cell wall-associated NlpC family hydrolase
VRYTWGGTSPSTGFDCSGLTQDAYRDLGITLPRTSRSQFKVGGFIPANRLDMLAPGDLVFFGYEGDPGRVHHVGMYVGNGDFVHAPGTGDQVKVSSLTDRIAARADYVGGVRP